MPSERGTWLVIAVAAIVYAYAQFVHWQAADAGLQAAKAGVDLARANAETSKTLVDGLRALNIARASSIVQVKKDRCHAE